MYVREQKKISLMEAFRKVALIPAQTLEKSTPASLKTASMMSLPCKMAVFVVRWLWVRKAQS
jgi:hypothetical protein